MSTRRSPLIAALAAFVFLAIALPRAEAAQNQLIIQLTEDDKEYLRTTRQQIVIVQPFNGTPSAVAWVVLNYNSLMTQTKVTWDSEAYSVYEALAVPQVGVIVLPANSLKAGAGGVFSYDGNALSIVAQANDHTFSISNETAKAGTFGLSMPYFINNVSPGNVPMQASVVFGHGSVSITAPKSISVFTTTDSVRAGQVMDQPPLQSITLDYSNPGSTHTITFNSQSHGLRQSQ